MSWWRDVCRQLARLSHLLHPPFRTPFLFSLFHMLVLRFCTASQVRLYFLLISSLIRTLQSTLTLLSIWYLVFFFAFYFLGADPNTFFFREVLLWICPLWVQVVWSVLQWCFKPIQSYQEKLSAVDMFPLLLNFWFLKRNFFLSIKWKCLLGTFLIFLSFSMVWREEKGWKKKETDGMRKKSGEGDERQKPWREKSAGQQCPLRSLGSGAAECESPFFPSWNMSEMCNEGQSIMGLLCFPPPASAASLVFYWKFFVIFILGQWGVR